MSRRRVAGVSSWGEQTVQRVANEVRRRRTELKLSAQALADRTATLGHPVSRTTIADLELGRRGERLLLPDLIVLAAALHTSPGALLYPDVPHGPVEVLPGVTGTSITAAHWLMNAGLVEAPGAGRRIVWEADEAEWNVTADSNEAVDLSHALSASLQDVEVYKGLAGQRGDDMLLSAYERHRGRALELVAKLRALDAPLDEELLASLGVIEVGDNG